jgi:hypothetical protein
MEKGTKSLLIISSIVAIGGLFYFLLSKRNLKALNIYSIGKSADGGKLYLYLTTKSSSAIKKFIEESNPTSAIQELDLEKNPNKSSLSSGKSIEIKGIDGLDGVYSVIGVLSPQTNVNRVMAVKIDSTSIPSTYENIANGNQNRFYAKDAKSVGKLIIK